MRKKPLILELGPDGDGHDDEADDEVRARHRDDEVRRRVLQVPPRQHRHYNLKL